MNSTRPAAARAKHSRPLSSLLGSLSYVKHRDWFCLLLMEIFLTQIPSAHRVHQNFTLYSNLVGKSL